ncbi:MAG: hypothetical protein OXC08_02820 [Thiotrichales bacterium]|nr:hypothetical protein [Thiotrichales bacterium]
MLSLVVICGAVVCAAVAAGVEIAGGIALLAVRMRTARAAARYRELRYDGDAWSLVGIDGDVVAIDPPLVHLAHRMVVVLEVAAAGQSDFLVFSPSSTPRDDLRRLRVRLRAGESSR